MALPIFRDGVVRCKMMEQTPSNLPIFFNLILTLYIGLYHSKNPNLKRHNY